MLVLVLAGYLGLVGNRVRTFSVHHSDGFRGESQPLRSHLSASVGSYFARLPDESEDEDASSTPTGAASYARYSSDMQDGRSISDQQRKCRDPARLDGLPILPEFEFSDEATSGAKLDRAGLDALMAAARAGLIPVVFFENLSRLVRDTLFTLPCSPELLHELHV